MRNAPYIASLTIPSNIHTTSLVQHALLLSISCTDIICSLFHQQSNKSTYSNGLSVLAVKLAA